MHSEIEKALSITSSLGGDFELKIVHGCPPGVNDDRVVRVVQETAIELLGQDALRVPDPEMGAEDFAIMAELVPGAMFHLGCRIEGDERLAHNPRFDIDEACLPIGAGMLTATALRMIGNI